MVFQSESQMPTGVRIGDIVDGKYRIDTVLGSGGMGIVVAAHHMQLDQRVAIKLLLPDALGSSESIARFVREAQALVKIKSEHVVRVMDVGTLGWGSPYMVMEYLEGEDLAALVKKRGGLSIEQSVEFLLQACEAMAVAHRLGIIHRDLKPANLFCVKRADGGLSIKVFDFGISKFAGKGTGITEPHITKTSAVFGSPTYMSPEQLESARNVDIRADIWSLGIILYELLTGALPFSGDTYAGLCVKIATHLTPSIRTIRPDIPAALEGVVHKCLKKDRNKRYTNVAELARALAPFGGEQGALSARRVGAIIERSGEKSSRDFELRGSEGVVAGLAGRATAVWRRFTASRGRNEKWLALGLAVLVCLVLGALTLLGQGPLAHFTNATPRGRAPLGSAFPAAASNGNFQSAHMVDSLQAEDSEPRGLPGEPGQGVGPGEQVDRAPIGRRTPARTAKSVKPALNENLEVAPVAAPRGGANNSVYDERR